MQSVVTSSLEKKIITDYVLKWKDKKPKYHEEDSEEYLTQPWWPERGTARSPQMTSCESNVWARPQRKKRNWLEDGGALKAKAATKVKTLRDANETTLKYHFQLPGWQRPPNINCWWKTKYLHSQRRYTLVQPLREAIWQLPMKISNAHAFWLSNSSFRYLLRAWFTHVGINTNIINYRKYFNKFKASAHNEVLYILLKKRTRCRIA